MVLEPETVQKLVHEVQMAGSIHADGSVLERRMEVQEMEVQEHCKFKNLCF